jgi:hypothetical protein
MDHSFKHGFLYFLSNRSRISRIWRDVVGEKVVAHTNIKSFEMGRLEIDVDGPAYLERYRYSVKEWIKRINVEFGDEMVTEIKLKVGSTKKD